MLRLRGPFRVIYSTMSIADIITTTYVTIKPVLQYAAIVIATIAVITTLVVITVKHRSRYVPLHRRGRTVRFNVPNSYIQEQAPASPPADLVPVGQHRVHRQRRVCLDRYDISGSKPPIAYALYVSDALGGVAGPRLNSRIVERLSVSDTTRYNSQIHLDKGSID